MSFLLWLSQGNVILTWIDVCLFGAVCTLMGLSIGILVVVVVMRVWKTHCPICPMDRVVNLGAKVKAVVVDEPSGVKVIIPKGDLCNGGGKGGNNNVS